LVKLGFHYSHSGCLKPLRRLDFGYRKSNALPRVAYEARQAGFIAFYEELPVTSGEVVSLFIEQLRFEFTPVFHGLQRRRLNLLGRLFANPD